MVGLARVAELDIFIQIDFAVLILVDIAERASGRFELVGSQKSVFIFVGPIDTSFREDSHAIVDRGARRYR